jgi:hypothetical protein
VVLDFRRLSRAEWLAGASGVALLVVALAFTWFAVKAEVTVNQETFALGTVEGDPHNAFESFAVIDLVVLVVALLAIAIPLVRASGRELPLRPWLVLAAAGLAASALIAYRIIEPPDLVLPGPGPQGPETLHASEYPNVTVVRKAGVWLGLGASLLVTLSGLASARRSAQGGGPVEPEAAAGVASASS